jgi:hypothetical protein
MTTKKLDDATLLERLGYSKQAQATYKALSTNIPKSISEIAREQRMHRPALYRGIDELVPAGFVIPTSHGKRTTYTRASRTTLIHVFAKTTQSLVHKTPPQKEASSVFSLRRLTGAHAIADTFDDVITSSKRGDTFYRVTSERSVREVDALLSPHYRIRRDAKKLERKVISGAHAVQQKRNRLERFIRVIDAQTKSFDHNIIELIYGNKIAYIDISKKESLIIEHAQLAEFHRTLFLSLYKKL